LQGVEQPQSDFGDKVVAPAIGDKRACGAVLVVTVLPSGVGTEEYRTTCVLIGVRLNGLLGTTGFGWVVNSVGAGLLFGLVGMVTAVCLTAGGAAMLGLGVVVDVDGRRGVVAGLGHVLD
jgi:hypothetical protein